MALLLSTIFPAAVPISIRAPLLPRVRTGADLLLEKHFDLIKGRRLGIVCNHTSVLSDGRHLVDVLNDQPDAKIVALFGPEHGIRGDAPDGKVVEHGVDAKTHLPVYSLYGNVTKPTEEMLRGIDILLFDIQDIGARFYTYVNTMSL